MITHDTATLILSIIWILAYLGAGFYMVDILKIRKKCNGRDAVIHTVLFWPLHLIGIFTCAIAFLIGMIIDKIFKK